MTSPRTALGAVDADRGGGAPASSGPLRADAERNREQIVRTARMIFTTEGVAVSMAEIARRAGVGLATVLRRFPTREALVLEVLREQLEECRASVQAALDDPDPWRAFTAPIEALCAQQAVGGGLASALTEVFASLGASDQHGVEAAFDLVAARAKATGDLRPDVSFSDALLLVTANAGVVAGSADPVGASRRFVQLALRSLSARR